MFTALALTCALQRPVKIMPPGLATADGITVGLTTVQQFERRFGKGAVHVGGHSDSGRNWYDGAHHLCLDADGFDFNARSEEIIDCLSVQFDSKSKGPSIRVNSNKPGILEKLRPGMSRSQIEQTLNIKLSPKDSVIVSGQVRYSKAPQNKDNNHFTTWRVDFDIEGHGLQGFDIYAD